MPGREELMAAGLPDYPSPDRAVAALRAMCDYAAWRRRPPRIVTRFPVNRRRVERIIQRHLQTGQHQIGEVEAKEILRAYDFNVPPGQLGRHRRRGRGDRRAHRLPGGDEDRLARHHPQIRLRRRALNLANAEQVRDAFDLMMLRIQRARARAPASTASTSRRCARAAAR